MPVNKIRFTHLVEGEVRARKALFENKTEGDLEKIINTLSLELAKSFGVTSERKAVSIGEEKLTPDNVILTAKRGREINFTEKTAGAMSEVVRKEIIKVLAKLKKESDALGVNDAHEVFRVTWTDKAKIKPAGKKALPAKEGAIVVTN